MTQELIKNKAASIRARLHNLARKENLELNALIVLYMQERILYRLGQSTYKNNFILKGGLLLFARHGFHGRPTQDMDLLCRNTSNEMDNLARIFKELLNQKQEDGLTFSTDTLTVESIAEDAKYTGVRVRVRCLLGTAVNMISIDIGFGDAVVPKPVQMQYPCILDSEPAPAVFDQLFAKDKDKNTQWRAFVNKAKLSSLSQNFDVIVEQVKVFIEPIFNQLVKSDDFVSNWDAGSNQWI